MSKTDQKNKKRAARKQAEEQATSHPLSVLQERSAREEKKNLPAARKDADRRPGETAALKYVGIAMQFLREAKTELKKVKWPTRKELMASTAVVIALVLLVSFYLGVIDFGLIKMIRAILG